MKKSKKKPVQTVEKLEAIHLVALAIDAHRKRGTPEHAKAEELSEFARKQWLDEFWAKKTCPHCGQDLP